MKKLAVIFGTVLVVAVLSLFVACTGGTFVDPGGGGGGSSSSSSSSGSGDKEDNWDEEDGYPYYPY
jgi:hypothetical protein